MILPILQVYVQWLDGLLYTEKVVGSNPTICTNLVRTTALYIVPFVSSCKEGPTAAVDCGIVRALRKSFKFMDCKHKR